MISIAICDDDRTFAETVERLLHNISSELNISIKCEAFFDGSALMEAVIDQKTYFDLVYLDIEMKDMDGIRAAQALRNIDLPTLIVYVSWHEEYWKELFRTEPFRFISKPIDLDEFRTVFQSACERVQKSVGYFTFSYKKAIYKIPFNRIAYFESNSRVITVHMSDTEETETDKFYGKMNDLEKQLASISNRFLRIHQSFLVNFDHIKSISFGHVVMLDGKQLQISEDRQKSSRARFCTLLSGKESDNEL